MEELEKTDLAYLAGLFDGEGCIVIGHSLYRNHPQWSPRFYLRLRVVNTCKWVLEYFFWAFGGNILRQKAATETLKECWAWEATSLAANEALRALYPYLKIKKPQAELALMCSEIIHSKRGGSLLTEAERIVRESYCRQMHDLNL